MAFATGLLPLANAIFRGDMPLEVNLSQGEQMEYVGQAVHQLVRENYLKRTVFQDFGQTVLEVTRAVESPAADTGMYARIADPEAQGCGSQNCPYSHDFRFWARKGITPQKLKDAAAGK